MPKQIRYKTNYPGVFYIEGRKLHGKLGTEKIYYCRFEIIDKETGKVTQYEEKCGRQSEDMSPARASQMREQYIRGAMGLEGGRLTRRQLKQLEADKKKTLTFGQLWELYKEQRKPGKGLSSDISRYELHLEPIFKDIEPKDITKDHIDKLKKSELLKSKSDQTIAHVLNLLTWICNHGFKTGICPGLSIHIEKPKVKNERVDYLPPAKLKRLFEIADQDHHPQVADVLRIALFSGLRRGEIFGLQWDDIDFKQDFITIRIEHAKSQREEKIKMNSLTKELLLNVRKKRARELKEKKQRAAKKEIANVCNVKISPFVFHGRDGNQRVDLNKPFRRIKDKAGLPANWRMCHSLRHQYASMMASSGKVDLLTLSQLLTHKDGRMTRRYAHLADEALQRAADTASDIMKDFS